MPRALVIASWTTPGELPGKQRPRHKTPSATRSYRSPSGDGLSQLLSQALCRYADGKRAAQAGRESDTRRIEGARRGQESSRVEDGSLMNATSAARDDRRVGADPGSGESRHELVLPVIPVCSSTRVGTLELLGVATRGFPSRWACRRSLPHPGGARMRSWPVTMTRRCSPRW